MTLHPLQYTLTHRLQATDSLPPSLFKAWFLFIKSVSSPFLISTFLLCWMLLLVSNPIPPSLLASISLSWLSVASLSSFHYPLSGPFSPPLILSLTLLSLFLSTFYSPPFLNILCLLKSSPRSFSVLYSLLALQLSSPLALFSFLSSLRPLTLYFPLAFLSPLFSFRSPFLLHSGCRGFVEALGPQWDIQQEKGLKNKLWNRGGRGAGGRERNELENEERRERRWEERKDGSF